MNNKQDYNNTQERLIQIISKLIFIIVVLVLSLIAIPIIIYYHDKPYDTNEIVNNKPLAKDGNKKDTTTYWSAPDISSITDTKQMAVVGYGKDLIVHTAKYFGPFGSIAKISNGLNCQNCHLQAGTAVYGNNYGSVASLYPKFRARSGAIENVYKRVNDCFERSLNGKAIDTNSKEMQSIVAYMNFIGSNVDKGKKAVGSGFKDLAFLDRAADSEKGQSVYTNKCQSCHQQNGEGVLAADKTEYTYPSLWGKNSFNDGAGLNRISNFAKYVKYNMPQGATHQNPQLTDEEAWDVAAFVLAQKRTHINVPKDWPDKAKKPVDHPFGPYADKFTEKQHKFGPFNPIVADQKKREDISKQKKAL